jgi:hypothetical protein
MRLFFENLIGMLKEYQKVWSDKILIRSYSNSSNSGQKRQLPEAETLLTRNDQLSSKLPRSSITDKTKNATIKSLTHVVTRDDSQKMSNRNSYKSSSNNNSVQQLDKSNHMMTASIEEDDFALDLRNGGVTIIDSGSSHHLTADAANVKNFLPNDNSDILNLGTLRVGSGERTEISGYGTKLYLGKVLVVPALVVKYIISVGLLGGAGYKTTFGNGRV